MKFTLNTLRTREGEARPDPQALFKTLRRDRSLPLASPAQDRTVSRHQKHTILEAVCKAGRRSFPEVLMQRRTFMKTTIPVLGIDIAKAKFDVCLRLPQGQIRQNTFANDPTGFAQLADWLWPHDLTGLRVGLEATGCYWVSLAHDLYQRKCLVCVLNPAYVKAHGQAQGKRSKTDRVDARLIADFVAQHDCEVWQPLPAELEELRELMRLYADVVALKVSAGQRAEGLRTALAQQLQAQLTRTLQEFVAKVLRAAKTQAAKHSSLAQPVKLLTSIKGVGEITALILTAELPRGRSARTVAGWAGVTPRQFESGTSVFRRPKMCKQGSDYVRQILYWPAITALRCNPAMQVFGRKLAGAGLNKMQIIGAAMHKLLRWAVAIINTGKPFDLSFHELT